MKEKQPQKIIWIVFSTIDGEPQFVARTRKEAVEQKGGDEKIAKYVLGVS